MAWCDDERNTLIFLKPAASEENDSLNIWKDVHEYLDDCSRRKYDDIKYVEYIYEPICSSEYSDDFENSEEMVTTEYNETLEIQYKNNYAYS